jgi:phosphoglycolate phosphatase
MKPTRSQPEAVIFDLDGTLFQTETLLLPAYHAAFDQLREEGLFHGPTPPEERILSALGMLLAHIWEQVMPDASEEARQRADELLLQYQMDGLRQGAGSLYVGAAETLQSLRNKGLRLFIASNGLEEYVNQVVRLKGIGDLFEGLYSAGEYQTSSKVDLVKLLLEQHQVASAWMVGDRSSDVEAGVKNGLYVVGCDYANFGEDRELDGADVRIRSITELSNLL